MPGARLIELGMTGTATEERLTVSVNKRLRGDDRQPVRRIGRKNRKDGAPVINLGGIEEGEGGVCQVNLVRGVTRDHGPAHAWAAG